MTKSGGRHDQAPAARSRRKNGGRASSGRRLSVHRLRKSIKAAPLYARLQTVRTAIIAAADAARADRSRIEAVLKRAGVEFIDENEEAQGSAWESEGKPRNRCVA